MSRKDFGFGYEESEDDNFALDIRKLFLEPHPENAFGYVVIPDVDIPDYLSMDPCHTHNTDATWDEAVASIRWLFLYEEVEIRILFVWIAGLRPDKLERQWDSFGKVVKPSARIKEIWGIIKMV